MAPLNKREEDHHLSTHRTPLPLLSSGLEAPRSEKQVRSPNRDGRKAQHDSENLRREVRHDGKPERPVLCRSLAVPVLADPHGRLFCRRNNLTRKTLDMFDAEAIAVGG